MVNCIPISRILVTFEKHQPADWCGMDRTFSRMLVLSARADVSGDHANIDVVAVELRAGPRSHDFDSQFGLFEFKLIEK